MTQIAADSERLQANAKQLDDVRDKLNSALLRAPQDVDAGEGSEPIADVVTKLLTFLAPLSESYGMLSDILRGVAQETIDNEEEAAYELDKIAGAVP